MAVSIRPYAEKDLASILNISKRTWTPVFDKMKPAVDGFVYDNFYPDGWWSRQESEIAELLLDAETQIFIAETEEAMLGFIGTRLHPEDKMGEVYILAVDPGAQRQGVASALMEHGFEVIRRAGMNMVMVETGGDPGHAPSRAVYESVGFRRWPVARYFKEL